MGDPDRYLELVDNFIAYYQKKAALMDREGEDAYAEMCRAHAVEFSSLKQRMLQMHKSERKKETP